MKLCAFFYICKMVLNSLEVCSNFKCDLNLLKKYIDTFKKKIKMNFT